MAERYTRKDAERAFARLCEGLGRDTLDYEQSIYDPDRNGRWFLDHNSVYGGYVVSEIMPSSPPCEGESEQRQGYTAETCPLGYERRSAREFVAFVNATLQGAALARK